MNLESHAIHYTKSQIAENELIMDIVIKFHYNLKLNILFYIQEVLLTSCQEIIILRKHSLKINFHKTNQKNIVEKLQLFFIIELLSERSC